MRYNVFWRNSPIGFTKWQRYQLNIERAGMLSARAHLVKLKHEIKITVGDHASETDVEIEVEDDDQ